MNQQWIDFKSLREQLDFAEVLRHYGVELKSKKRDQLQGFCPLPNHNGQKKSPSFSVNLERKIWKCFGCNRGGNVLDLAIVMEGKDPDNRHDVRAVALLLQERYGIVQSKPDRPADRNAGADERRENTRSQKAPQRKESNNEAHEKAERASTRPATIVNAPLDFELRGLDSRHPYLKERGFTEETIMHFGLGFCNRGLMQGRVVIPLRDHAGKLIGYAGRFTRDDQVNEKVPKYLFPSNRERNGTVLEFHKSLFLYNGHAIKAPVRDLVVVDGFASTWWLHQAGFENVVAIMGSSCSAEQGKFIHDLVAVSGRVWIMPDAGEAGECCAEILFRRVAPYRSCRWVKLEEGQPTDLSPHELAKLLDRTVVP
jgi:DNA primase